MGFFRVLLVGFSLIATSSVAAGAQAGGALRVVADIAPVRALVRSVAGTEGRVEQIVPDGVSPHEFALKPSQLRALQAADLIVWLGPVAMPGLAKLMADPSFSKKAITLNALKGTRLLPMRKAGLGARARATNQAHDPHSWLDPANAIVWVDAIAQRLSAADPAFATRFQANGAREVERIRRAVSTIKTRLNAASLRPFVQFHDAFQYFETRFGLVPLGLATTGDSETTSLGVTTALRATLKRTNGACVFTGSAQQTARAGMLLDLANVWGGTLDALGRNIAPEELDYPTLLSALASDFIACLAP